MPKKKKSKISENQIRKELSKINLELDKINTKKPELKLIIPEKQEESEENEQEQPEEQETEFNQTADNSRASRRFTAPILLPSGQETVENLEEFAALMPSSRGEAEKDVSYTSSNKTYEGSSPNASYSGKTEYSLDAKYTASDDSLASSRGSGKIISPSIREDFTRGRLISEMQPAGGAAVKTDWEDRSRLEEFTRMQSEYQFKQEKEQHERKRRA